MTFEEFKKTLNQSIPPENLSPNLMALWLDAKGEWEEAHTIVQQIGGSEGNWIHAYLHRKEGDQANASYWYSRAGRQKPDVTLEAEWEEIVRDLLVS